MLIRTFFLKVISNEGKILTHHEIIGGHPLGTYAKFSEKLTFLTP